MPSRAHRAAPCVLLISCLALLVPNSAPAVTTELIATMLGEVAYDRAGEEVASAGDFNGDGYQDVIVGAPEHDATGDQGGRAYLLFGGPDADGVPDLIFPGKGQSAKFGNAVAGVGDFNNDGYDDVLIGAPGAVSGDSRGRAYLYFGGEQPDAVEDMVFIGQAVSDEFGKALAGVGDVNGDGFPDVAIGAPGNDLNYSNAGAVYLYHGGDVADTTADRIRLGEAIGYHNGFKVAAAGDVNGDGYDDVLTSYAFASPNGTFSGRAWLYFGPHWNRSVAWDGKFADANFGRAVAGVGDINNDGYDDVLVSSDPGLDDSVFVYLGGHNLSEIASEDLGFSSGSSVFGRALGPAGDVNADGYDDFMIGAPGGFDLGQAFIYYGSDVLDTNPDVILAAPHHDDDYFGEAVARIGDFNGNGQADFVVGARNSNRVDLDAGAAYVFSVYRNMLTSPVGDECWISGEQAPVTWVGDDPVDVYLSVNGGLSWTVVAHNATGSVNVVAPEPTELAMVRITNAGETPGPGNSVVSQTAFKIIAPPAPVSHALLGTHTGEAPNDGLSAVAGVGDVNADGFDDYMVGALGSSAAHLYGGRAYLYWGGPSLAATPALVMNGEGDYDGFGSVAWAGDVNGDGYNDMLVGAIFNATAGVDAGRAYLYYGGMSPDSTADLIFTAEAAYDEFGWMLSGLGDLNGDGFGDWGVTAHLNDGGGSDAGRVYVYAGGSVPDNVADLSISGSAGDYFGSSISDAGDMNGDGYADFVVGADGAAGTAGKAYVFFGGAVVDSVPDWEASGEAVLDQFGHAVTGAGDMNGDGYDDIAVAGWLNDAGGNAAGRVYVYFGGASPDTIPDLVLTGMAGDQLGERLSSAGDANGDGFADLLVAGRFADGPVLDAGRAFLYYGAPIPDSIPDLIVNGEAAIDRFGEGVAGVGDVTGDGFDDFLVGADLNNGGGTDAGRVYFYDCDRYHLVSPAAGDLWNVGAEEVIAWRGAEPADIWLSVNGGDSYSLLLEDVGGHSINSLGLVVPHQPTKFGKVQVTPHNASVNGSAGSDSLFTIEASIVLLNLLVAPVDGGGVLLTWETDPGPEDLMGYKVERAQGRSDEWQVAVTLTRDNSFKDPLGSPHHRYRLTAINGLGDALLLGETGLDAAPVLSAWPLPYRGGDMQVSFWTAGGVGGAAAPASVLLYDVAGRLVRTVAEGSYEAGFQTATWDGRNETGLPVANGVYFLKAFGAGVRSQLKIVVAQ